MQAIYASNLSQPRLLEVRKLEVAHFDPYLYTYCSLSTLKTMTEKGTLRFSDIRKSNDGKELVYGFNQVKKRLETLAGDDLGLASEAEVALRAGEVLKDETEGTLTPLSDDLFGLCERYNNRLYAHFLREYFDEEDVASEEEFLKVCDYVVSQLGDIGRAMKREREGKSCDMASVHILTPRCLALCFTGNGDLLSQWRGYGDDGRGVAVGFRRSDINALLDWWNEFENVSEGKRIHLGHGAVYYRDRDDSFTTITTGEMRHRRFMEERWELTRGSMLRRDEMSLCDERVYRMLQHYLAQGVPTTDDVMTRRREIRYVFNVCKDVAPLFKQRLFYEEEEERLFLWMEGGQKIDGLDDYIPHEVGRVVRDSSLVSYLDLTALKHGEKRTRSLGPAPVVSVGKVVIGPRCGASEHDIASLFSDYEDLPEVVRSGIPYVG